ncbi:MAG: hypothetical protein HQK65_18155, partial [Desulfamplus sp.]|nr:hypothetical protein [Desulfamplus sp.]
MNKSIKKFYANSALNKCILQLFFIVCFYILTCFRIELCIADENIFWVEQGIYSFSNPNRIVFFDDEQRIAVLNNLNEGRVSLVENNYCIYELNVGKNPFDILSTKEKLFISNYGSNSVTFLSQDDLSEIKTIQTNRTPSYIALSSDGSKAYVSCPAAMIVDVVDIESNLIEMSIYDEKISMPANLAVYNHHLMVAEGKNNAIVVLDEHSLTSGVHERLAYIPLPGTPSDLSILGANLYISSQYDKEIYIVDLKTYKLLDKVISVDITPCAMISDKRRYIYVLNCERSGSVSRLDTSTNLITHNYYAAESYPKDAAISPDGTMLYVVNSHSDSVTYNFLSGELTPDPSEALLRPNESVTLSISGGGGDYFWSCDAGTLDKTNGSSVRFTAPDFGGVFNVIVVDTQSDSKTEVVINVNDLLLNPSLITVSDRSPISFNVTGGAPPFSFEVPKGGTYERSSSNSYQCNFTPPESAGIYTLLVRDKNNFTFTSEITYRKIPLTISPKRITMSPLTEEVFTITGGIPPYTVTYGEGFCSDCELIGEDATIHFASSKNSGETYIRVFDSTGKSANSVITVYDGLFVSPSHLFLPVNTSDTLTISGGTPKYTIESTGGSYNLSGNEIHFTGETVTNDRDIHLTIRDEEGKSFTALITVTGELSVSPKQIENSGIGETHKITVTGGTGDYTWFSDTGTIKKVSRNEFLYTAPKNFGTDKITFRDTSGETKTIDIHIVNDNIMLSPSKILLYPSESIELSILGGLSPYSPIYEQGHLEVMEDRAIFQAPKITGMFEIGVKDQSGQEVNAEISVISPISLDTAIHYVNPAEEIVIVAHGGTGEYQFAAESGELSATRGEKLIYTAPQRIGNYWVRVTDSLSNVASCLIVVGDAPKISPSYVYLQPSEVLDFNVQGGFPP